MFDGVVPYTPLLPEATLILMTSEAIRYSEVARILHWLIAGLIVLNFVLHELAEEAGSDVIELAIWANHKSVGMTVLMLAVIRLNWRFTHPAPALPATMPSWQVMVSKVTHVVLYALIFIMPLSGWLYSSASAYSVSWFNLFVFPDLVWDNESLAESFEEVHEIGANVMFVLALLHILAALKHAVIDRDGVLSRMSSLISVSLFVIAIGAGLTYLNVKPVESPAATVPANVAPVVEPVAIAIDTSLPLWTIDYSQSSITFTAEQAGAPFTGTWSTWTAEIRFLPDNLGASSAQVLVDVTKTSTGDDSRDGTMASAEWFDTAAHPQVRYHSIDITMVPEGGFHATGMLRIRNSEYPVLLTFSHMTDRSQEVLTGTATLDRLALNLGTGDWADTSSVGQMVKVDFKVTRASES